MLLFEDEIAVGCARLIYIDQAAKIGRVAVKKEYRKKGYGKSVCQELIRIAKENDASKIILDAQLTAVGFYKKLGFSEYGEVFYDANIEHIGMEMNLE